LNTVVILITFARWRLVFELLIVILIWYHDILREIQELIFKRG